MNEMVKGCKLRSGVANSSWYVTLLSSVNMMAYRSSTWADRLANDMTDSIALYNPGLTNYYDALRWQWNTTSALLDGTGQECLAILQHHPVYTLGRHAKSQHFLIEPSELMTRGAEVVRVGRGGDVTFHGPGQLVAYPILDLRRRRLGASDYVRALEETLIETLARLSVTGERVERQPGVWVGDAKLAAVGVRVRRGVSSHGLALNISTDLSWFDSIVPCGLVGSTVTSLAQLVRVSPAHDHVEQVFSEAFEQVFDVELELPGVEESRRSRQSSRPPVTIDGR